MTCACSPAIIADEPTALITHRCRTCCRCVRASKATSSVSWVTTTLFEWFLISSAWASACAERACHVRAKRDCDLYGRHRRCPFLSDGQHREGCGRHPAGCVLNSPLAHAGNL